MRPGIDRSRCLADPLAAARTRRRLPDEPPDLAPQITRRRRGLGVTNGPFRPSVGRFGFEARGQFRCRHEAHQVPARRLRHVHHEHALRLSGPDPRETRFFFFNPSRLGSPTGVDADALPVAPPAGARLVQASGPCEPVADPILDDSGLLVKDAVLRDRRAFCVAGHGDLHFEESALDHPRKQFQRTDRCRIGRSEGQALQPPIYLFAEALAPLDRLDLRWLQGAAHNEPHAAVVSHQTFDAARGERQGARIEISSQPVVALRVLKRGNVEQPDEIAVLGGVLEPPFAVPQHGQGSSSRLNLNVNCSGPSTRSL